MSLLHNTAAIRNLLISAFSDSEFDIFSYDYFRPAYNDFSAGMGKSQKMQRLIEYCETHVQFDELLARVQEINPKQYADWLDQIRITVHRIAPPPSASRHFIGRKKLLAELGRALTQPDGAMIALQGMGGVGKTELTCMLATGLQPHFSGGVLWADLPALNGNAIIILQSWGQVWGANLADESNPTALALIVRALLTDHQTQLGPLLIVIDDLRDEWLENAQLLQKALPRSASLLITTREEVLVEAMDCRMMALEVLSPTEALELLQSYAGLDLVKAEAEIAGELVSNLGCLPLGVKLAGQWLARFVRKYRRGVVAQLKEAMTARGLDSLDTSGHKNLTATFALSYEAVEKRAQRVFRGLGIFAAESFRLPDVAGVLGVTVGQAEAALDKLAGLALLEWGGQAEDGTIIYTIHPLLKQYAHWLLLARPAELSKTRQTYIQHYLALAEANAQNTPEAHQSLDVVLPDLLHAAKLAAELGQHPAVSDFGLTLWERGEFLFTRGYYRDALELLTNAAEASRSLGDEATEAIHLKNIGKAHDVMSNLKEAEAFFLKSLTYFDQIAENYSQHCDLRYYLACLYVMQQKFQEATDLIEKNLAAASHFQDVVITKHVQAQAYYALSNIDIHRKEFLEAQKYVERCLELYQELEDTQGQAEALFNLANILARLGNSPAKARECYMQSLVRWRKIGNIRNQAHTLWQLSILERELHDYPLALEYLDQAATISQKISDLYLQVGSKVSRGLIYLATQKQAAACEEFQEGLSLLNDNLPNLRETINDLIKKHCLDFRSDPD